MGDADSDSNTIPAPAGRNGHTGKGSPPFPGSDTPWAHGHSARQAGAGAHKPGHDTMPSHYIFIAIRQYKWLIVAVIGVFSFIGALYASMRTPIYRSAGTMLIKQSRNQYSMAGSDLRSLLSSSYGLGIGSTLANELQVLKSFTLSGEIARHMHRDQYAANGRLYPALWRTYPADSALTSVDTTALRIQSTLEVAQVGDIGRETDIVQIAYSSPCRYEAKRVVDLAMEVYSDLSTKKIRESAGSALGFLTQEKRELRKRLRMMEDSLNRFMKERRFVHMEAQTVELIHNIAELESRKQEAKVKKAVAESGIQRYRDELQRIRPGYAGLYSQAIGPKMQRYQYELAELETERLLMKANNPGIAGDAGHPEWDRLNGRIAVVQDEIDALSQNVMDLGDQFAVGLSGANDAMSARITGLYKKLFTLQLEAARNEAGMAAATNRLGRLNRRFEQLPDNMTRLARLKRKVKISEQLYLTISRQTSETAFWEQTRIGKGVTIDAAYLPRIPMERYTQLYALFGFMFGALVSAGLIFARETMNTRIDGEESLRHYPYPVLAVIPDLKGTLKKESRAKAAVPINGYEVSASLVSLTQPTSAAAEAFRRLRHNLIHSHPDWSTRTLMVTSAAKEEGKTSVIGNLAVVLAETGKRVLLLDLDLRRPNIHRLFGLPPADKGIVEVLFGHYELSKAIRPTAADGVEVLLCGTCPLNPSSISHSRGLSDMVRALTQKQEYDHILFDTAPYGIITDAGPLIELSDRVILVTRFGFTEQAQLQHTIENLQHIQAPVVGSVLTAFNHRKSRDSYYSKEYYREVYER